ncbi:MAG TPA: AsmA-like C-terminal domain-containing protein [Candidatus Acidoferrales bacterium]|nr:AsmA-like C-terminal domain-containing protein [Candidatus Acidoferrales bacterium]
MRARRLALTVHLTGRFVRVASALVAGIVTFLVLALFLLNQLIEAGELRRLLVRELEAATQLQVKVGAIEMDVGGITGIALHDVSLIDPADGRALLRAPEVVTRIALQPLWRSQIVVDEIRLRRPELQVTRDEAGEVDLWGILQRLLFRGRRDFPFALDVETIRLEDGRVSFHDRYRREPPLRTELERVELTLTRASETRFVHLRAVTKSGERSGENTPGVDYRLTAVVQRDGRGAGIASRGTVRAPDGEFELRRARWDAELSVAGWPSGLLEEYYRDFFPARSWSGTLSGGIRFRGAFADSIHAAGEVAFRDLRIAADQLFAETVSPGQGRLSAELEWERGEIRLKRFRLNSAELSLDARGTISLARKTDPYLRLRISTPFVSLTALRGYLPQALLPSPSWRAAARAIRHGEIRLVSLELNGHTSELGRFAEASASGRLALVAEIRDAALDPWEPRYLPLQHLGGQLALENGVWSFNNFSGSYGRSRLLELSGARRASGAGERSLELRARLELDLGELYQQARNGALPEQWANAASKLRELDGKAAIELEVRGNFQSPWQVKGQGNVAGAALAAGEVRLRDLKGRLGISPAELKLENASASFAGSPITLSGLVRDYLSDNASFELTAQSPGVNAAELGPAVFGADSPPYRGMVRGWVRWGGSLRRNAPGKLSGMLELEGLEVELHAFRASPRAIFGTVKFDGKTVELKAIKAEVGGYGLEFSGRLDWAEKPRLVFNLTSPEIDIGLLLPKETSNAESWYDRLNAKGKVSVGKGRFEKFEFANLQSDLFVERRLWRLENFSAESAGGRVEGRASFLDRPAGVDYVLEPKIQDVAVERLLSWFDTGTREISGNVNLEGRFESSGVSRAERKRNMSGHFKLEIQKGVARRLTLLARILNLMDLGSWFSFQLPDLTREGIHFRRLTADFTIARGVYATQNLLVDSDDISISAAGSYDAPNDVIDAVVALRPFPRLGSVVSYIPIIGPGIAGIKDSILVGSFRVQGPVEEAVITPAPLSTLSEFFFSALRIPRRMLTLPGGGSN